MAGVLIEGVAEGALVEEAFAEGAPPVGSFAAGGFAEDALDEGAFPAGGFVAGDIIKLNGRVGNAKPNGCQK